MKIILRLLVFITSLSFGIQAKSQCTVTNVIIQNIDVVSGTNTCTVTFDASFNIQNNSGNKFIFIHAWLLSDYPNYFQCVGNQSTQNGAIRAPEASDLAEAFLNIGINNNEATPLILTTYPQNTQCATWALADWLDQRSAIIIEGVPQVTGTVKLIPVKTKLAEPSGRTVLVMEATVVSCTLGSGG